MATAEKLLQNIRNNPRDWRIEDLKMLADRYGIEYRQARNQPRSVPEPEGGHTNVLPPPGP